MKKKLIIPICIVCFLCICIPLCIFIFSKDKQKSPSPSKNYEYLANGATVECTAYDKQKDAHTTTFTVIILGDVNKSGKVDMNDAQLIAKNYLGTAEEKEKIVDELSKYAADVNLNGKYKDSNDAHLILKKINYWNSKSEDKIYDSALAQ